MSNPTTAATTGKVANKAKSRATSPEELTGKALNMALTGLFLAMFVSMLSMNVVGTSMPVIIADLGGTQSSFTWVVTATMLASAISTPIWGKFADLTNKKVLIQAALITFVAGSALAGLAPTAEVLIAVRVIQGIGAGGLGALVQIVLAEIVSPRDRGKYAGIMGAIMGVSTVAGPLLGGMITDTIGWRWNFYVSVPIAIVAILFLQFTLHLVTERRQVKIDYLGAMLISVGFSALMLWITMAGSSFDWLSLETVLYVGIGVAALALAVVVEMRAAEPIIPLHLFKNPTFSIAVIASLATGIAMFSTMIYLGQYMQLARGKTPTEAGLLTLPMVFGMLLISTIGGNLISRYGKWKALMVAGSVFVLIGLTMFGFVTYETPFWYLWTAMFVLGAGTGLTMQNLVLVTQNTVDPREIGVASSGITFFRTLAGTAGTSVMGSILASHVKDYIGENVAKIDMAELDPAALTPAQAQAVAGLQHGKLPSMADLPEVLRLAVEQAYGHAISNVFLAVIPVAVVGIIAIAFLPNKPLSTKTAAQARKAAATEKIAVATGAIPVPPVEDPELTAAAEPEAGSVAAGGAAPSSEQKGAHSA